MQTEKRVNVPDIRDLMEFWELKERIKDMLQSLENIADKTGYEETAYFALVLCKRIELIGKKEGA